MQQEELSEEIDSLRERRDALESLKNLSTKYDIKRFYELITEKRLGLGSKAVGRPSGMDQKDEEFVLRCIESKTTTHGRRSDQGMYTDHRAKKKDFVKLVNYHRHKRNLCLMKSSKTVHICSRPCNKRSKQSKLHVGLGLFCAKKPPKTGNNENEPTHHQRAHEEQC